MSEIKNGMTDLIGKTPILRADRYRKETGMTDVALLAKPEYFNPAGSVKIGLQLP